MKITVTPRTDIFKEGNLVCPKDDTTRVYLVTVIARGYDDNQDGTFWAIDLFKHRISGGNYRKDLFQQFNGVIEIEV